MTNDIAIQTDRIVIRCNGDFVDLKESLRLETIINQGPSYLDSFDLCVIF